MTVTTRCERVLITGSCGFIGTNIAVYYLDQGLEVYGIDNMSRRGSKDNLEVLRKYPNYQHIQEDVIDGLGLMPAVDAIFHMAAQVGVGKSIKSPRLDLFSNTVTTFEVLEYARRHDIKPFVVFASTNKVYGDIQVDEPVGEDTQLNFHTPYGVSKGAADQYVLDYSRIYDIPTVSFRQSCIYGPYQHGAEEQGWVAWFLIANRDGLPITIFGNGHQVRDVLHVDDLVRLYDLAWKNKDKVSGQAYNTGGGPENVISLMDLIDIADIDTGISYDDWRPADQKYYVSDISKLKKDLNWEPAIDAKPGILSLKEWFDRSA